MIDLLIAIGVLMALVTVAFVAASQTAFFSLSQVQVKAWRTSSDPRKRSTAELIAKPRELLVTLYILDVVAALAVQNLTSSFFGAEASWWLKVALPLGAVVLIGDVIPKSMGFARNVAIATHVAPLYHAIAKWIGPFRKGVTVVVSYVSRILFFYLRKPKELTTDELHELLHSDRLKQMLSPEESHLVEGFFTLQESTVKELMHPREEILWYECSEPLERLIQIMVDQKCSRVPVASGTLDNLLGVLSAHSFFLFRDKIHKGDDVKPFLDSCFFIPEATRARSLLSLMPARGEALAIVVDEYGMVSGLVAWEDLVEEIIGPIVDERSKKQRYTKTAEEAIIASGKLELVEFAEIFGEHLKSGANMTTLGGWLTEKMGDIPKVGDQLTHGGYLFQILASDGKRVRRVWVKRIGKR